MGRIIGIDLGTTNSVVAYFENGKPEVIPNSEGNNTTPSIIYFDDSGDVIVGDLAKRQLIANPLKTISSIKRLMGVKYSELENLNLSVRYELDKDENDNILVKIGDRKLFPEEISAEVLKKMKKTAEDFFGEEINDAIITVPAYFNDTQRQATKKAAELAGLQVFRIINEPTAASLAYGLNKSASEKVAVFDFGGGTFDFSVLEIDNDVFEVKSTSGDTHLGGDDIDNVISNWIIESIKQELTIDVGNNLETLQRIRETSEKIKCELSTLNSTIITLPYIYADESGVKHFEKKITRNEFNALVEPILSRLLPPCRKALADAGFIQTDIDTILLVGGSTRIPAVQDLVKDFFKKEPLKTINPDEAVAVGASIQGGIIGGTLQEILLLDVTPLSLGIELQGGVFSALIPRNSSIPTTATKNFTTVVDNQPTVKIHVLQGERKIAKENHSLGYFILEGIPPAPREVPEIEVKFRIDANGILNVSATDLGSGINKEITIQSYIDTIMKDYSKEIEEAKTKFDEDLEFLKRAELKNRMELMRKTIENYYKENSILFSEEDVEGIQEILVKIDFALIKNDTEELFELQKQLLDICNKYHDLFYLIMS